MSVHSKLNSVYLMRKRQADFYQWKKMMMKKKGFLQQQEKIIFFQEDQVSAKDYIKKAQCNH